MIHLSAYGRLARDPREVQTKTGTPMAVATIAVSTPKGGEDGTTWVKALAFGQQAEALARHSKGDLISVCGRARMDSYTTQDGTERQSLEVVAEQIISARSVRPGGGRKKQGTGTTQDRQPPADFDDALPF